MRDMAIVVMVGHLTHDPEIRKVKREGKDDISVCEFSIAVNFDDHVSFVNIETWGRTAENCQKYLVKGKQVGVSGRYKQERWEKDGQKKSKVKITDATVQFFGNKNDGENSSD